MPRLSKKEREQSIGMFIAGASKIEVARRFGCNRAVADVAVDRELQRLDGMKGFAYSTSANDFAQLH